MQHVTLMPFRNIKTGKDGSPRDCGAAEWQILWGCIRESVRPCGGITQWLNVKPSVNDTATRTQEGPGPLHHTLAKQTILTEASHGCFGRLWRIFVLAMKDPKEQNQGARYKTPPAAFEDWVTNWDLSVTPAAFEIKHYRLKHRQAVTVSDGHIHPLSHDHQTTAIIKGDSADFNTKSIACTFRPVNAS